MRGIAGAMLAAGMAAPGGATCVSEPDDSGGIGVEVSAVPEGLRVDGVWVDRAAHGVLHSGDQIVAADGEDLASLRFRDRVRAVRGPVGEPVELDILRDGLVSRVTLERAALPFASQGRPMPVSALDLALASFQGCGVHDGFRLELDADIAGRAASFRVYGDVPDPTLRCVVDIAGSQRWVAPGTYSIDVDAVAPHVSGVGLMGLTLEQAQDMIDSNCGESGGAANHLP
ncbi:MAG: PDZ domain-containing protein [Myxococcota bacterium]